MTIALAASPVPEPADVERADYLSGACNIGPAEITRRRRAGNVGALITLVGFAALVALQAPPPARLLLALPAAGAASGYLQAWLRFCAGFGSRGVFNFGELGQTTPVADPAERARDRLRATQIGAASLAIGVAAAIVAVLLPL